MQLSHFVKAYPCPDKPGYFMLFSTKTMAFVLVPEKTMGDIEGNKLTPSVVETLARMGFLVPDTADEREEMLYFFNGLNRDRKEGSIIAVLNVDCNLACTYCFEGGMKGKRFMPPETAELLIDYLQRNYFAKGKTFKLFYYGGEPLLSLDLITSISLRLNNAARLKGLTCSYGLFTNGTLLSGNIARELAQLGVTTAQVTLDGPRENHDRFRPFVSGKGSFNSIVQNLKEAWEVIDINLVGNYNEENYQEFPRLLDYLYDVGLTPEKIKSIKFSPIAKSGGDHRPPEYNEGCVSLDEPWMFEAGLFLREEILRRGYSTPKVHQTHCAIELDDDVVVTQEGELYKCPAFIGWKNLAVGNLKDGIRDFRTSHKLDVWKKEECLNCEYLPLCFGGCRLMKLLQNGSINDVDCKREFFEKNLAGYLEQDMKFNSGRK